MTKVVVVGSCMIDLSWYRTYFNSLQNTLILLKLGVIISNTYAMFIFDKFLWINIERGPYILAYTLLYSA